MADILDEVIETLEDEDEELTLNPSILDSIMGRLGVDPTDNTAASYREDVMQAINGAIVSLVLAGIGPEEGFRVSDSSAEWEEFLGDTTLLDAAKNYIFLRCKLEFDPPTSGTTESFNALMDRALHDCKIIAEFLLE